MARAKKLMDGSITAIASRCFDTFMIRCVVRDWPGGIPDVFLERVGYGDEAEPYPIEKQTKIRYSGERIHTLRFDEEGVHWVSDDQPWFVRVRADGSYAEKAIEDA